MRGIACILLVVVSGVLAAESTNNLVELKGVVSPKPGSTNLQFKADSGKTYEVLPTRDSKALYGDTNLLNRTLLIKGKQRSPEALEVIGKLYSVQKGKTNELYYYCDICSIESSFPGQCMCCREPMVLHERAVKPKPAAAK